MLNNSADFKYETPYIGPFEITQCWTNVMVTLQYREIKIRYNIHHIKLYTGVVRSNRRKEGTIMCASRQGVLNAPLSKTRAYD